MLHELQAQKYFAETLKSSNQFGVAVAVLRFTLTNVKKNMPGKESWKSVIKEEIDNFSELLRKHEHENEFVWHEKVPSEETLLPKPEGNKIANIIPYQPKTWERQLTFKI